MNERSTSDNPTEVTDPVCKMRIGPSRAAGTTTHGGVQYYFCSPGCLKKFEVEPDRYLQAPAIPVVPDPSPGRA